MDDLQLGQEIALEDGDYVLESIHGGVLGLRNSITANRMQLHVSALPLLLNRPPVFNIKQAGPRSLEGCSGAEASHAVLIAAHLEEMLNGTPLPGESSRSEYDPYQNDVGHRIELKAAELNARGVKCSARSVRRWADLYRKFGAAGLLDKRAERKQYPFGNLDVRVKETLISVIGRETKKSTGSVDRLILSLRSELIRLYPGEEIAVPSNSTLRRHINELTRGKYTTGNAANRRTAANAPKRMFSSRPAVAPGHEVQVDSSPFDVLVVTGIEKKTGRIKTTRASLVIMLDKATQSIIATSIRLQGVKGVDLAFMLAQCLTPRPLRPNGLTTFNEYELAEMPWAKFLNAEEFARCELTRPFIRPQRIMKDNGADYASVVFESACTQFGIDTTNAAIHTPTDKPNVERAFHTIKTKFAQFIPGFSGGSVDRRGDHVEQEELIDVYTLADLFDRWVSIVWQNMQHESLRDPLVPSIIHSPNSMYMAMFPMTGFVPIPLGPDDYIELLPTKLRSIKLDGIQIDYRRFDAPELHPYRLQRSDQRDTGGKWTVHYNPHDPSAVWIRDPESGGWIQCDWMNRDAFELPFSASIRRAAREYTAIQGVLGDEASMQLTVGLVGQTKSAGKRYEAVKAREESARKLAAAANVPFPSPAKSPETGNPSAFDEHSTEYQELGMFDPREGIL